MRKFSFLFALGALMIFAGSAQAQTIYGDYIETRSADVWTGPCVANGEVGLVGDQAILAWKVSKGELNGVSLDGLSVVGVVKAGATLGDQYNNPYPAKAVMIVDSRANAEQRKALMMLAHQMGGRLFENVVRVETAPIEMEITDHEGHPMNAVLRAGTLAGIETRAISKHDHLCGNEDIFYQPLSPTTHAMPAVAELDQFQGTGLGVSWTLQGKRSAFVGSFAK
jgi:hypothetical protein